MVTNGTTEAMREYIDYIVRVRRNSKVSMSQLNKYSLNREIGCSYGVTSAQMDSIDWSKYEE